MKRSKNTRYKILTVVLVLIGAVLLAALIVFGISVYDTYRTNKETFYEGSGSEIIAEPVQDKFP